MFLKRMRELNASAFDTVFTSDGHMTSEFSMSEISVVFNSAADWLSGKIITPHWLKFCHLQTVILISEPCGTDDN